MDWKREAVDKLRCYEARRTSIGRAERELKRLEDDMTRIRSAATDGMPRSGGAGTKEDAMVNNIARREELRMALNWNRVWVEVVDSGLAVLDKTERHILDLFYIHRTRESIDQLCEELAAEKATVYRRKDQALRHFTLALYGVTET